MLASDSNNFHYFRLWELALAPSVLQKKILFFLYTIDQKFGGHLKSRLVSLDKTIFGEFRGIHDIGINKAEEDEALFIYNLSSVYFSYLVPEVSTMDDYLHFDSQLPEKVRQENMNFYYRLIQRHKYFFDPQHTKYFLSKNPGFVSKISSIADKFPEAKFLIPNRSPFETIPSTISLNKHIYNIFCKLPNDYPLIDRTRNIIKDWYIHLHEVINKKLTKRALIIDYKEIITEPTLVLDKCYKILDISIDSDSLEERGKQGKGKEYRSPHQYPEDLGLENELEREEIKNLINKINLDYS